MIPRVYSLEEARDWFINHSSGEVMCCLGEKTKIVNCFPDAKAFYEAS